MRTFGTIAISAVLMIAIAETAFAAPRATAKAPAAAAGRGSNRQPTWRGKFNPDGHRFHHDTPWFDGLLPSEVVTVEPAPVSNYITSPASASPMQEYQAYEEVQQRLAESKLRAREMLKQGHEAEMQKKMAAIRELNVERTRSVRLATPVARSAGEIHFPAILQDKYFADYRAYVKQLAEKKSLSGTLSTTEREQIDESNRQLLGELKENAQSIPCRDYVAALKFVRELSAELKGGNERPVQGLDNMHVSHLAADRQ